MNNNLTTFQIDEIIKKASIKFNGNIKLGNTVGTISKMFSDETWKDIEVLKGVKVDVQGTCIGRCHGCRSACYVRKSYRYPSVRISHARMTIAMRNAMSKLFARWNAQLTRKEKSKKFNPDAFNGIRVNQSGELETKEELACYGELAENHPSFKFWVYTKAYDLLNGVLENMPNNFYTNISIWGVYGLKEWNKYKHLDNVHAFVYVDDFFTVEWYESHGLHIDTFCKAYDETGRLDHNITCDKCRKCIDRKVKVIGCYGH